MNYNSISLCKSYKNKCTYSYVCNSLNKRIPYGTCDGIQDPLNRKTLTKGIAVYKIDVNTIQNSIWFLAKISLAVFVNLDYHLGYCRTMLDIEMNRNDLTNTEETPLGLFALEKNAIIYY